MKKVIVPCEPELYCIALAIANCSSSLIKEDKELAPLFKKIETICFQRLERSIPLEVLSNYDLKDVSFIYTFDKD